MVIFSDHGNLLPHKEKKLEEWSETEYTFHEDRVQIPLVIKSPENGVGLNKGIISLAEINEILLALMEKREYIIPETEYVKLLRSPVYTLTAPESESEHHQYIVWNHHAAFYNHISIYRHFGQYTPI